MIRLCWIKIGQSSTLSLSSSILFHIQSSTEKFLRFECLIQSKGLLRSQRSNHQLKFFGSAKVQTLGLLSEKRERFHCAMQPPFYREVIQRRAVNAQSFYKVTLCSLALSIEPYSDPTGISIRSESSSRGRLTNRTGGP